MTKIGVLLVVFGLVIALGCSRGTTFIGREYQQNESGGDVDTGSETDSNSDSESNIDSDSDSESNIDTDSDFVEGCGVPTDFQWSSSQPLILPPSETGSIKDPTVLYYDDEWLVYATSIETPLTLTYLSFTDWADAGEAAQIPMQTNENFSEYIAAPQLFYFSPQELWYLVFQTQEPSYATNEDPTNVETWSAPTQFMQMPYLLTKDDKMGIDFWVICDDTDCYLFFSALDGGLYRARTTKEDFPEGFGGTTEIVMTDDQYALYDACNVYKMAGTDQYLLLVSALANGRRYFRFWISDRLDGDWTPIPDTDTNIFASMANIDGADWSTFGISHGEMLRKNPDETMTIDTCDMQYLYSGLFEQENTDVSYYALGLLTDAR